MKHGKSSLNIIGVCLAWVLSLTLFVSSSIYSRADEITPEPEEPTTMSIQEFMSTYHVDFYDIMSFMSRYYKVFPLY